MNVCETEEAGTASDTRCPTGYFLPSYDRISSIGPSGFFRANTRFRLPPEQNAGAEAEAETSPGTE